MPLGTRSTAYNPGKNTLPSFSVAYKEIKGKNPLQYTHKKRQFHDNNNESSNSLEIKGGGLSAQALSAVPSSASAAPPGSGSTRGKTSPRGKDLAQARSRFRISSLQHFCCSQTLEKNNKKHLPNFCQLKASLPEAVTGSETHRLAATAEV